MSTNAVHFLAVSCAVALCAVPVLLGACGEDADLGGVTGGGGASSGQGGNLFGGGGTGTGGFQGCVAVTEHAENTMGPATVLLFIDNSPSMRDEIMWTRDNMNTFSQTIEDAGLDLQVVVIGCMEEGDCDGHPNAWGICIPAPLGAVGGCDDPPPYQDTNLPEYLHIDLRIPSVKGFERVIDTYDQWKEMLRPNTPLHIVGISDDTEEYSAAQFNTELLALDPSLAGYFFHAIYSFQSKEAACLIGDTEPCCEFAAPNGEGVPYRDLANMTGGVSGDLCDQAFEPVFQQFANAVIESATLSCEWIIPPPPDGETLDPGMVNVLFINGDDESTLIGKVDSAADCSGVTNGWYYDDPNSPTMVLVCPQTCEWIQGQEGSKIDIQFGCETEYAPPR